MHTDLRKILITGANRGIGFETAKRLKEIGHHVILSARDVQHGKAVAAELEVDFLAMDVSTKESIRLASLEYKQCFGDSLDVLINNAGIFPDKEKSILEVDPDLINEVLLTNTVGPMLVTQYFLPFLKKISNNSANNQSKRIINLSSKLGQLATMKDTAPAYSISKTALNALTRQQAAALTKQNISVNAVSPGWVRTDMGGENADLSVEEGADSVIWLATDAPQSLTGKFVRDRVVIEW